METRRRIQEKIDAAFAPAHLEVSDETGMHNVPPGSESHFRLLIVSEAFENRSRVQRHQAVYRTLSQELAGPVHALGLQTLTPQEWSELQESTKSPPCLGGDGTLPRPSG
jgi:BolA family transcriptional regulator, general stress-responsive regulator